MGSIEPAGPFVSNLGSTGPKMVALRPTAEGNGLTRLQVPGGLWQEESPAPCPPESVTRCIHHWMLGAREEIDCTGATVEPSGQWEHYIWVNSSRTGCKHIQMSSVSCELYSDQPDL